MVEARLQHVVNGGGGRLWDLRGRVLARDSVVGRHGVVYVVHFVAGKIQK